MREADEWEEALKVWWHGRNQLDLQGRTDPRLGLAFIELATEQKAANYYGTASEMYLWSFAREVSAEFQKVVTQEAERIIPLLDEEEAKEWRNLIKAKDAGLSQKIRLFWLQRDTRPATDANERLIEHWQRIAYARQHFTKNRNGVYDCDDRGTIYVKYGKPLRKKSGAFGTSSTSNIELMRWIGNPLQRMNIRLNDRIPEYEVWLYADLGTQEPSIYLFSQRDGTGSYGLRYGIEFLAGGIYQIMYYADLMIFDSFFEERYAQLEDVWQRAQDQGRPRPNYKLLLGISEMNKAKDRFNPTYKYAVIDKSDFEERFGSINLATYNFRNLDSRNRAKQTIIAVSSPQLKIQAEENSENGENLKFPDYRLKHTLIIRDNELRQIERRTDEVPERFDNVSLFTMNHLRKYAHYTVAAEARASKTDTLLALGKGFLPPSKALNSSADSLELSDLLLGVELPPESVSSKFVFPLMPAKQIWRNDPLKVYLEVYHLQPDTEGFGQFTIDFGITRLDKKGRVKKKEGEISLTFEFRTAGQTSKEDFSIDVSKLQPGKYQLTATVKDEISSQEKSRSAKFTVVKN